jgi:F0F1-type ATP synthase epsilon subunit
MQVTINSPTSQRSITATWVSVETTTGNITFLLGHAPTVVQLKTNSVITLGLAQGTETISASQGVVHATRTEIQVLLA